MRRRFILLIEALRRTEFIPFFMVYKQNGINSVLRRANPFIALAAVLFLASIALAQPRPRLPHAVDLVPEYKKLSLPPEGQGGRDVCSLFAITSLADLESARDVGPAHKRLSPEFLIWAARKSTGHKGEQAMFFEAVHGLNALGICPEEVLPYSAKPDLQVNPSKPALADARELAHRWKVNWIKRWDVKRPLTPAELLAIKAALAAGHPVACGLRWPKTLKGHELLAVPSADEVSDGHSIAFVGYEDNPKMNGGGVFRFRNSWGTGWGEGGYGLMSYAYARAYANDAVWLELGRPGSEVPIVRFEAEKLPVLARGNCEVREQDMRDWGGAMWTHGKQLFCSAKKEGFVELGLEIRKAGRYRVRVLGTAGPDFGKVRIALDGKAQGPDVDLYCGRVSPSGTLELGTHELSAGRHTLVFKAVGRNVSSTNFFFGLDAVDLLAPN